MGPDYHIDHLCQKTGKILENIAKLRHFVPRHVLLTIYYSLISPYLHYGIFAWGQCAQTYVRKLLQTSQRRAILIFFISAREYSMPLLYLSSNVHV